MKISTGLMVLGKRLIWLANENKTLRTANLCSFWIKTVLEIKIPKLCFQITSSYLAQLVALLIRKAGENKIRKKNILAKKRKKMTTSQQKITFSWQTVCSLNGFHSRNGSKTELEDRERDFCKILKNSDPPNLRTSKNLKMEQFRNSLLH